MINQNKFLSLIFLLFFISSFSFAINNEIAGFPFKFNDSNMVTEGNTLALNGNGELDISTAISGVKLNIVSMTTNSQNNSVLLTISQANPITISDFEFLFNSAEVKGEGSSSYLEFKGSVTVKGKSILFEDLKISKDGIHAQTIEKELDTDTQVALTERFGVFTLKIKKLKLIFEGNKLKVTADGDCDTNFGFGLELGKPQPFNDVEYTSEEGLKTPKPIPHDVISINFAENFYLKIHQIKLNFEMSLSDEPVEYRYLIKEENGKSFLYRPDCKGAPDITKDTRFYDWDSAQSESLLFNEIFPAPGCIIGDQTYVLGKESVGILQVPGQQPTNPRELLYGAGCNDTPVKGDERFVKFVKLSEIKNGTETYTPATTGITNPCHAPTTINQIPKPTYKKSREWDFSIEGQATLKLGPVEFEINKFVYNPGDKSFEGQAVLTPYKFTGLGGIVEEITPSIYGTIKYSPTNYFVIGDASNFTFYHPASNVAKGVSEQNKRQLSIEDALNRGFKPDPTCFTQHNANEKSIDYFQKYQGKYIIQDKKLYLATSSDINQTNFSNLNKISWDDAKDKKAAGENFEPDSKCLNSTLLDAEPGTEQGDLEWELGGQVSFKIPALSEDDELTVKVGVDNKLRLVLSGEVPLSKVATIGPFSLDKVMVAGKFDLIRRALGGNVPEKLQKWLKIESAESQPYLVYIDGSASKTIYLPSEDEVERVKKDNPSSIKLLQKTSDIINKISLDGYNFSSDTEKVLTTSFIAQYATGPTFFVNDKKICSNPAVTAPSTSSTVLNWDRLWDDITDPFSTAKIDDTCFTDYIRKKTTEYESSIMVGAAVSLDLDQIWPKKGGKISLGSVAFDTEEGVVIEGEYEMPSSINDPDYWFQLNKLSLSAKIALGRFGAPDSAKGETSRFEFEGGITGTFALKKYGFADLSFKNLGVSRDKKGKWKFKGSIAAGKEKYQMLEDTKKEVK